jgi:hypothetical protein
VQISGCIVHKDQATGLYTLRNTSEDTRFLSYNGTGFKAYAAASDSRFIQFMLVPMTQPEPEHEPEPEPEPKPEEKLETGAYVLVAVAGDKYYAMDNLAADAYSMKAVQVTVENGAITSGNPGFWHVNVMDESGNVPVMMYHGIHGEILSKDTGNTGGNVDVDGYQRTADAFEKDLEMYYKKGYRMIRLNDYLDGKIDVEAGKSPIVLTFDDGLENNIRVTGVDKNGELKIDPKSAVGILEKFKKKYPDFHVTATFFITGGKFSQPKYDEKIIKWLIDHDYDVGNHTWNHPDFTELTTEQANE